MQGLQRWLAPLGDGTLEDRSWERPRVRLGWWLTRVCQDRLLAWLEVGFRKYEMRIEIEWW